MTGLLECLNRLYVTFHLSEPTTEVSAHSARYEEVPRIWPFKATEKLDPDVRELLSMHCSWCVLDCGEAQPLLVQLQGISTPEIPHVNAYKRDVFGSHGRGARPQGRGRCN